MKIRMSTLRKIIKEACGDPPAEIDLHLDQPEMPSEVIQGRDLDYSHPSEGSHAKKHLYHTSEDALKLHGLLRDEDNIPTWCLEYLAIARHGVGVVHDYLSYKMNQKK